MAHGAVGAQCWAMVQALLGGISLQSYVWLPGIFGSALAEWSRLLGQLCLELCFWGEGGLGGGCKAPSPAAELLNVGDAESAFLSTSPQTRVPRHNPLSPRDTPATFPRHSCPPTYPSTHCYHCLRDPLSWLVLSFSSSSPHFLDALLHWETSHLELQLFVVLDNPRVPALTESPSP